MSFHVGQKVVCVDVSPSGGRIPHELTLNAVYTVSGVEEHWVGVGLLLAEVPTEIDHDHGYWAGFALYRFRPVVEDRKSVSFTMGADPESERWDGRRKVNERA